MATTTKKYDARNALADYYVYAPLGAGQLLLEKGKELSGKAADFALGQRKDWIESYQDLARRGEKIVASIRRSPYTHRAIEQTKVARSQVKAASTSVRRAADTAAEATRQAAKKVG